MIWNHPYVVSLVNIVKKYIGKAWILLSLFSALLALIISNVWGKQGIEFEHKSGYWYRFTDGLQIRHIASWFCINVVALAQRYLEENGFDYDRTLYDLLDFIFSIYPYLGALGVPRYSWW